MCICLCFAAYAQRRKVNQRPQFIALIICSTCFWALCPSSGVRDYMCVITAYGMQCLVAGCRGSGAGQQAMRPGRGMLHDDVVQHPLGRVEVQLHSVFRPRHQKGVRGQCHAPAAFCPSRKTRYPLYKRLDGPQCRSGRRKISPHRDSIPRPSSPQSVAIPTELPGSHLLILSCYKLLCLE